MKRRVILSERSSLWEAGDAARSVGMLEHGRLGVMTDKGLIGTMLPGMMIGETAIFTLLGERSHRIASVFSLEEGTTVTEFSIFHFKQMLDDGDFEPARQILLSLIIQACRDFELVVRANEQTALIDTSLTTLSRQLTAAHAQQLEKVNSWDSFFLLFRFLYQMRDFAEAVRRDMVVYTDRNQIARVSEAVQRSFQPHLEPIPMVTASEPKMSIKSESEMLIERFEPPTMSDRFQARRTGVKMVEETHRFNE